MTPYSISSDHHFHDWSQFSKTETDGVNSRLRIILDEFERQAEVLLKAGGKRLFMAGDTFHVRGKVIPEVLNPVMDTMRRVCASGVEVFAIAGNHDLSTASSTKLGNSMQALDEIPGFTAVTAPSLFGDVMMIPWIEKLDELRATAAKHANKQHDLIIHAPLNGVIKGLPDLGLDPSECEAWGYRRVFIGHYHAHRVFQNGSVISIGSTSHQCWSDPGTLAGFLIVHDDRVEHHESQAPKFVNIDSEADIAPQALKGNYARLRLKDADAKTLTAAHAAVEQAGALGWVDHSSKKRDVVRPMSSAAGNMTLEVSVANYVLHHTKAPGLDKRRIAQDALAILTQARSVGDE